VAAYFAVSAGNSSKSAAIWMLDPYALNEANEDFAENFVYSPGFVANKSKETEKINLWLPYFGQARAKGIPKSPVAVYPAYFARRIENQKSSFTVHGSEPQGLTNFWQKGGPLLRIVIPAQKVRGFRSCLSDMGVDTASIYPDLDGLGRLLREKWGARRT
jgi:hypothetical protein